MHILRSIFTTLVATTLSACVVTETADTTPPSAVRCSFLTADERAELVAAMKAAETESAELQSYLAFRTTDGYFVPAARGLSFEE